MPSDRSPSNTESADEAPHWMVKRRKVTRACDYCKSRKRRCTGEIPCKSCYASGLKCKYTAAYTRGKLVDPVPSELVHLNGYPTQEPASVVGSRSRSRLPPCGMPDGLVQDSAPQCLSDDRSSTVAKQYLGPTSPFTFLRQAWKRFEDDGVKARLTSGDVEVFQTSSVLSYGDRQVALVESTNFRLPKRSITSALVALYFELVMPTYRILHRQTVAQWLSTYHQFEELDPGRMPLLPARQVIVLMVLAIANLFRIDEESNTLDADEQHLQEAERIFQFAQRLLDAEHGKPTLESVQARLTTMQYLQHTQRPNKAWYVLGTTIQLMFAMGMHRRNAEPLVTPPNHVCIECRKRAFWTACTADMYLSIILGRPTLVSIDDVDQSLPEFVDDENLTAAGIIHDRPPKDTIIAASIYHSKLACTLREAAREHYSLQRKVKGSKFETAVRLNAEVDAWYASLPLVLSGGVHASSLIPVLRRQAFVIRLAHDHAIMFINRPSLLIPSDNSTMRQSQVDACITAAKDVVDALIEDGKNKQSFWFTSYVTFNALSIIYIWIILRKHRLLPETQTTFKEDELFDLAVIYQQQLVEGSHRHAPSLRFGIVLEELQQEAQRMLPNSRAQISNANLVASSDQPISTDDATSINGNNGVDMLSTAVIPSTDPMLDMFSDSDFYIDPDLWLQIDSFPFSDFSQMN